MNSEFDVIERISTIMVKKGISKSELANRCLWPMPRVSKVLSGAQKVTVDDLNTIAKALQINPAVLISPDINDVNFDKKAVMPLTEIFEKIGRLSGPKKIIENLVENELPRTMNSYLDLAHTGKSLDVVLRRRRVSSEKDFFSPYPRVTVTDDREGQLFGNELTVGYWFDEDWSGVYLAIHYLKHPALKNRNLVNKDNYSVATHKDMRELFVALSNGQFDCSEKMRISERSSRTGMRYEVGCIFCKRYDFSELQSEEAYRNDLLKIYKAYLKLLDTASQKVQETFEDMYQKQRELDRKNNFGQSAGSFGLADFDRMMKPTMQRGRSIQARKTAIEEAEYLCEINPNHKTFVDRRTDKPYMEIAQLIPYSAQKEFERPIEVGANYCCLCPVCKAKLAYGRDAERQELLMQLYLRHKMALMESGIDITPLHLFKLHGMK